MVMPMQEQPEYLAAQLITYLGNKRALLDFIGGAAARVKAALGQDKLRIADLFSGSGAVSRYFKRHAGILHANDLEPYAHTLNRCYLPDAPDFHALQEAHERLARGIRSHPRDGFIAELYAPQDEQNIQAGERCFFTPRNARFIDTARQHIGELPPDMRPYFLAPLLAEVSVKNNTAGVFKGFYKDKATGIGQFGGSGRHALSRITREIELPFPVFSRFSCPVHIYQEDANALAGRLPPVDLAYLDPPYNQHPYGSNYFMLNLVDGYRRPDDVSEVSGIPAGWNRSAYNKPRPALNALTWLCRDIDTKFLLVSFSSEGFITKEQMTDMLSELGRTEVSEVAYNTFRGSRNLRSRDIHVKEYLFLVDKR
jgi:adenine-specific DNA-methyltransferase